MVTMRKEPGKLWRLVFRLTPFVVLAACTSGGQTGEDSEIACKDIKYPLASIESISPLGFSASQILSFATGRHESTLAWHDLHNVVPSSGNDAGVSGVDYRPGPGETPVALTFTYSDGAIRFLHREPVSPAEAGVCNDSLEIDVDASLVTGDGALDESFATTLYAYSSQQANWGAIIPWSEITGSFRVTTYVPDFAAGLPLSGSVTPIDTVGHVGEPVQVDLGPGNVSFADWPAGPDCDGYVLPLDTQIQNGWGHQVSGNDVIAFINSLPPIPAETVGDPSSPKLTLRVSPEGQTACVRLSSHFRAQGNPTINLSAHLNATTDDSLLRTDLPIKIEALQNSYDGRPREVTLSLDSPYDKAVSPSDLFARLGYPATDLSAYDAASCSFEATYFQYSNVPLQSDVQLTAGLQVYLYSGAPCAQDITNHACIGTLFERKAWRIEF
jgi:hypothetical protein